MHRTRLLVTLAVLVAALALPGVAQAQSPPVAVGIDTYYVLYFDNANTSGAPDGTLRIVNTVHPEGDGTILDDTCAMIYVFDPKQELAECCGCKVTPNGLLTLSVNTNLAANTLTSDALTRGAIFVVSAAPNVPTGTAPSGSSTVCDPGGSFLPGAHLENWITNPQPNQINGVFQLTESHPGEETFNSVEATALANKCLGITSTVLGPGGSGHGLCNCIGDGDSNPLVP